MHCRNQTGMAVRIEQGTPPKRLKKKVDPRPTSSTWVIIVVREVDAANVEFAKTSNVVQILPKPVLCKFKEWISFGYPKIFPPFPMHRGQLVANIVMISKQRPTSVSCWDPFAHGQIQSTDKISTTARCGAGVGTLEGSKQNYPPPFFRCDGQR